MSLSIFVLIIGLAFLLAAGGVFFVLRSYKKAEEKRDLRRYFADKMVSTPLPKMLQALGIGGSTFLYRRSIDTVADSINNCENCTDIAECSEKLRIPELNPEDIEFCLNKKYLIKFSRSERIKNNK
jgi:hypothetical protein